MSSLSRSRIWLRYLAAGVVGAALVVIALYVVLPRGCGGMLSGGSTASTGECVGLVADSTALDPQLRNTAEKILKENTDVSRAAGPYVKIALLSPLTTARSGASAMSLDQIKFSLEGSFAALYRVNHSVDFGDPNAVRIQLLLANQGSRQEYSDAVVKQILDQSETDHPVVAVVGLGSSFPGTATTAKAFADRGIPMVSAVASATNLEMETYKTLHSVSPSNRDYALALKRLLDDPSSSPGLHNGIIVQDLNDDPYTKTLKEAFVTILQGYVKFPAIPFKGGAAGSSIVSDVFAPVVTNLCNAVNDAKTPLDTVFFAGRVADFRMFAEALEGRTCQKTPLAVLVGATGFHAAQQYSKVLERGNVTVIYSSSADGPAWVKGANDAPEGFGRFLSAYRERGFADVSLTDGYAIMYHDALATAAQATRLAALGSTIPQPAEVNVQFGNLTRAYAVRAASGTFSFADRPDGRAMGKVVVYRQIGFSTPYRLPASPAPYVTQ